MGDNDPGLTRLLSGIIMIIVKQGLAIHPSLVLSLSSTHRGLLRGRIPSFLFKLDLKMIQVSLHLAGTKEEPFETSLASLCTEIGMLPGAVTFLKTWRHGIVVC